MLWIKSFHLIFVITWFAGLFYLPRLFVYHAMSEDAISIARFKIMARKLYYGIMMPSAVLAIGFGVWLFSLNHVAYMHVKWMHWKLVSVLVLLIYHFMCDYYRRQFLQDKNSHSHVFYRWFNEVPVVILCAVVFLVILKPA